MIRASFRFLAAVSVALLASSAARADTMSFSKNALIIPMQSRFQPAEGMLSAYGLVYRILQANAPGHRNAANPVTVYVTVASGKQSPNHCKPSNLSAFQGSVPTPGSAVWDDSCDLKFTNSTRQPVVPVNYSVTPYPPAGYSDAQVPTFDDSNVWPRYTTPGTALTTANGFKDVGYLGGPFVIDAIDAPAVIDLIRNGDTGPNAVPKAAIDIFSDGQKAAHCTPGTSPITTTATSGGVSIAGGCHYVYMHQATVGFTANVLRRINVAPPPFAMFEDLGGTSTTSRAGSLGAGILDNYLLEAGLYVKGDTTNYQDSRGCPANSQSGCKDGSGSATQINSGKRGNIYDLFTLNDVDAQPAGYSNGILNQKDGSGNLVYQLFWAPHWDATNDARATDANGIKNLVSFVGNGGNVMTECESIAAYENFGLATNSNFLFKGKVDEAFIYTTSYHGTVFQTNSSTLLPGTNNVTYPWTGVQNCADPGASTTKCVTYGKADSLFSQVGDWLFTREDGSVSGFKPHGTSTKQDWTTRLMWTSDGWDVFDMGQQDATHGTVIYVGGHDVSADPQGARIVLNSMLNLAGVPLSSERALSAPVIATGRTDDRATSDAVLTATYDAVTGYAANSAIQQYTPGSEKLWVWPYYPGHFRSHTLSSLATGENSYSVDTDWDAASLGSPKAISPAPASRNLFTYFGGYPKVGAVTGGGGTPPHNILQVNWYPEAVEGVNLSTACNLNVDSAPLTCLDVMGYNTKTKKTHATPTFDDLETGSLHMVVQTGGDGFCDLQQVGNFSKLNSGNDWGGSNCNANDIKKFLQDAPNMAMLYQRVRGYCFAGAVTTVDAAALSKLAPSDSACTDNNDNRAHLGGLVHSTPAVVGPSPNVSVVAGQRPTVAYVGGYDGQLHAFYVGGGDNYKGPTGDTFTYYKDSSNNAYDPDASAKFKTDYGGVATKAFTKPALGTELWSFIPASQLPHLADNSAQVDSSPVVMDVFADFASSGLREWHTVLVQSIGKNGDELLALDITNPLHPRLLWDVTGSLFQAGSTPYFSPTMLLNDSLGSLPPTSTTQADLVPKWKKGTAKYQVNPGVADTGRTYTKVYDYQDLGGSSGLSLAELRVGLEPVYVVYAATNKPGGSGIEVFAIDVASGQRLWQWEKLYTHAARVDGAWVPPVPSVIYGSNGASRIMVGDAEGQVWELDALTGVNVNVTTDSELSGCSAATPCEYPAFDVGSTDALNQPITTNIAVAKLPSNPTGALAAYPGATVLVFGTAGADWVASPSTDTGNLHVVLYDQQRVPIFKVTGKQLDGATAWTAASVKGASGVLQEPAKYPMPAGERLYGNITISGQAAIFETATDAVSDIMNLSATTSGHTYAIDLGAAASSGSVPTALSSTVANYGGVAVYLPSGGGGGIIADEASKLNYISKSSMPATLAAAVAPNAQLSPTNKSLTYQLRNWILRFLK